MAFSLFTRVAHRCISPISGEIIVKELLGQYTLYVDQMPQSGGVVKELWQKGIKNLPDFRFIPQVLLLGLGGGSAIFWLKKRWPKAKITSVELDPQVVVVARTYFGLDQIPDLRIITDDAFKVVDNHKFGVEKGKFDLIIVDIYLGRVLPEFAEKGGFVRSLKQLLTPRGMVVFNHLLDEKGRELIGPFEKRLQEIFSKVQSLKTPSNKLLYAYQG